MSNGSTPTVVKSNGTGSFMTVILGVILSGVIGFGAAEWRNRQAADFESVTLPENALKLPKELELMVGEPTELRAETRGRKVMWLPLDKGIKTVPIDSKAVWVYANEKGDYRVIAWTAINGMPTRNQLTVLHAKETKGDQP
jgi:hypothetical protein